MDVTRPRATKLSQIAIDADLDMGLHVLKTDTVAESTEDAGVAVDGVDNLDGKIPLSDVDPDTDLNMGAHNITTDALIDGKDVATSIANSVAHIAATKPHSGHAVAAQGNFIGDSTVNRAIPHGLGKKPKVVFFYSSAVDRIGGILEDGIIWVKEGDQMALVEIAVSVADATNIYVGNATDYDDSFNYTGRTQHWYANG